MPKKNDDWNFKNIMNQPQAGECGTRPGKNNPPEPVHCDCKCCKAAVVERLRTMYGHGYAAAGDAPEQEHFPFMDEHE